MTALVVDDVPAIRALFSRVLRGSGMHVLESESAGSALELAHSTRADVIVTDIQMAGLSGIELCRLLRSDATFKNVLIVVVSGAESAHKKKQSPPGVMSCSRNHALRRCCWPRSNDCS